MSDHTRIDRQSAALHRAIAARLRADELQVLERAQSNLGRWRRQFGGRLPNAYLEWERLLNDDLTRVLQILEGDDEDSARLRSSSPFTGVLGAQERWKILRDAA